MPQGDEMHGPRAMGTAVGSRIADAGHAGDLHDAYMIASLVVARKIDPLVAGSLIATLAHDLGYPDALARFVGSQAAGAPQDAGVRRSELIEEACRELLCPQSVRKPRT